MITKTFKLARKTLLCLALACCLHSETNGQTLPYIWNFDNPNQPSFTTPLFTQIFIPSCQLDDTYWIGPNMNSKCIDFNNLTGFGNFLTVNSGTQHFTFATTSFLTSGNYNFSARLARRNTWSPNEENFQLMVGNTVVGNFILNPSTIWNNVQITMNVPPGVSGNFSIFVNNTNGKFADFSIDNITINTQCPAPTSAFDLTSSNGVVKTDFCLGEDILLNGSASTNELGYMISVQDITGGQYPVPTDLHVNGNTWFQGQIGTVNLSQAFANLSPSYRFQPGHTYQSRLALYNSCISWVSSSKIFTVTCCSNFINPSFALTSSPNTSGGYQLTAVNYNPYPFINAQHTWYVYSYSNPNGPFTPVTTLTGPNFVFNGNDMQCYLVIHKLITACGEICWGQTHCNNAGLAGSMASSGGPYNGLIPNCVLPPVCQAPTQLGCVPIPSIFPNAKQLRWTNVPGAMSYQLIRVYNDPACCSGMPTFTLPPVTVPANQILPYTSFDVEPDYIGSCFSWRIAVTCANGLTVLSPLQCYGPTHPCTWSGASGIGSQGRLANPVDSKISSYPNPVLNGSLILSIQGVDELITTDILIFSMDGRKLISQKSTGSNEETITVSNLPAGLYIVKAYQNNEQVYVNKFEKQ